MTYTLCQRRMVIQRGFRNETSFFVCILNESPDEVLVEMMKAQYCGSF